MFGSTDDWNLRDIIPVIVPPGNQGEPLILVVIAGVNGLRYKLLNYGSGTIGGFDYSYGNLTGQFNKLAGLYESYRLKRVSFNWRPEVL